MNLNFWSKNWLWVISAIVVILIFQFAYGLKAIVPTNISWLMTAMHDWGQHYLGWYFYRNEPWTFPLGEINNCFHPVGTNVGFTDSIPLLAIFFKLFSFLLPEDFQYFGIWLFLCHLLAAYFTIRLLLLLKVNKIITLIAVIFIVANPVLIHRGIHPALCAHWLIIASIYFYCLDPKIISVNKILSNQFIVLFLSGLINPYMCLMVFGFTVALSARLTFFDKILTKKKFFAYNAISIFILLLSWYIVGMLSFNSGEDLSVDGSYGLYSLNLNALFNSSGWSKYLPELKQVSWHQYEGFMYLGLGMLLLLALLLLYSFYSFLTKWKADQKLPFQLSKKWLIPLVTMAIVFTLFAITNKVSFNDKILFKVPLPHTLVQLGETFRASGRFFWIPYYLIILFLFIAASRINVKPIVRLGILTLALIIQLYDTNLLLTFRNLSYGTYNPPIDKNWKNLIKEFDEIVFYPPLQAHYLGNLDYQYFAFLAARERKPINIGYVARADYRSIKIISDSLAQALTEGELSPKALYITLANHLNNFSIPVQRGLAQLNTLDNYYYVFVKENAKPAVIELSQKITAQNRQKLDSVLSNLSKQIVFKPSTVLIQDSSRKLVRFLENVRDKEKYLLVEGWAFVEGSQNNKGDSVFITLRDKDKFYSAPANIKLRPDVSSTYKMSLDNAGFNAVIFKDDLQNGKYELGIFIKKANGETVYELTDNIINVEIPKFSIPKKASAFPLVNNIIYGIDQFESESDFLTVSGWAAFENMHATNSTISLVLKNGEEIYVADVERFLRPDVNGRPGNKYDLNNTGFKTKLQVTSLPAGKYELGILIINKQENKEGMIMTNKPIDIKK